MATEYSRGHLETFIKEITKLTFETDTGKCTGMTEAFIKANGKMVFNMVMVNNLFTLGEIYVPGEGLKKGVF